MPTTMFCSGSKGRKVASSRPACAVLEREGEERKKRRRKKREEEEGRRLRKAGDT